MKTAMSLAAACGLLTTLAFAQSAPPPAQEFVNKVAISDMFEIQSSQLALSKQADVDTKPFAEKMVTDHQKTSSELKSLIDSGKVKATLPTALDAQHQKMLDEIEGQERQRLRPELRSDSGQGPPGGGCPVRGLHQGRR
jgi:putative membrane protein